MKLILGTAQFGSNYGINNSTGVLGKKKIDKIIKTAYKNNIRILDTAIEYRESTKILSKLDISKFKIVSKLPFFKDVSKYDLYYRKVIETYFDKLKTKKIYCFLVHNPEKFSGYPGLAIQTPKFDTKKKITAPAKDFTNIFLRVISFP